MLEILYYFRCYLQIASIVIAIIYLTRFVKQSNEYKLFTLYLIYIAIIQVLLYYHASVKISSIYLFHFYFIGQFILLSFFYKELLKTAFIDWILLLVLLYLSIYYVINPQIFYEYHISGVLITQILLVFYSLYYFYKSLSSKRGFVYVNTGALIYFLTSVLFFASGNIILDFEFSLEFKKYVGIINDILYFIFQLLIFIEWYRNYRLKTA